MEREAIKNKPKESGKISTLGQRLREIRKEIEKEREFKPMSIEEVRKEVNRRRTGNFDE